VATGTATVSVKTASLYAIRVTSLGNGFSQLDFSGIPGRSCAVQYAASLQTTNWQTLGVITADISGGCCIQDTTANAVQRVYRATSP